MYEYKFIKLHIEGTFKPHAEEDYSKIISDHANDGWRLHQLFAPSIGIQGLAPYIEIILERELK